MLDIGAKRDTRVQVADVPHAILEGARDLSASAHPKRKAETLGHDAAEVAFVDAGGVGPRKGYVHHRVQRHHVIGQQHA